MAIIEIMIGAITCASLIAALIFVRFWKSTRDRFFLYFAVSFAIEGISRLHGGLTVTLYDDTPERYLIRLVSYSLILLAIWEKNRPVRPRL